VGPDGKSVGGQVFRRRGSDSAILVAPPQPGSGGPTTLYEVTMERQGERKGSCSNVRTLLDFPPGYEPAILFDENTEHVAVAVSGGGASPANVTLYTVTWAPSPDNKSLIASLRLRSQVTDPEVVAHVRNELAQSEAGRQGARATAVTTVRLPGGAAAAVDGHGWRLFSEAAQRVDDERATWVALVEPGAVCSRLEDVLKAGVQPGFQSVMHEHGDRCFEIQRGNPEGMGSNNGASPTDEAVLVAVYAKPLDVDKLRVGDAPPAAIASLSGFGRFARENSATWLVGVGGEFDGWIARKDHGTQGERIYAAPWSTPALKRLAQGVLPAGGVPPAMPLARARPAMPAASAPPSVSAASATEALPAPAASALGSR
jgi:hypothetical protein